MYVKRNTEALSCNHCCSGKAISIIYSECMFVSLVIQHEMCMHHIVISGQSDSTLFFHIISETARFQKIKVIEHKNVRCGLIYNFCMKQFSFYEKLSEIGLHVKYPLFLSDYNETNFDEKFSKNIKHRFS